MSLEEVREDGADVATLLPPSESSVTEEKPKAVRRRRTTKTTDESEGNATPANAEVTASDLDAAKPVRKRITRKKDATPSETEQPSLALGEVTPESEAPAPKTTRRTPRAKATSTPEASVETVAADVPAPSAPNPPAAENASIATREVAPAPISIPTPVEVGLNPVVEITSAAQPPANVAPQSAASETPGQYITDSDSGSYVASNATPGEFVSEQVVTNQGQFTPQAPAPSTDNLLPVEPGTLPGQGREDGGFNPDTGYRGEESGFRNGRMSYRDRRALRREQRLQNRAQRFGDNGEGNNGNGQGGNNQGSNGPIERERERERPGFIPREREREGQPNQSRPNTNYQMPPRRREYDMLVLDEMDVPSLMQVASEFNIAEPPFEKSDLIYAILEAQAFAQNALLKKGVLEIASDGKGFLRCDGYTPSDGDVYVSQTQIKRFNLKTGDMVLGAVRAPKETERFHGLLRVEAINGIPTELMKNRKDFEKLTPIFPNARFILETEQTNITARIIDLVSPIGKGQRGLIVAPPKAGKTTLLKSIANSITRNNPEVDLFVLLIDERPEEVTDISRSVRGEVVASTFDEMPENHMRVADIVMERAKRLVEMQHDVVILLDSITRLSRASNLVVTPSGRTLSGGLDPAAMYRPKRMFGAARNIEQGGSLTILATALVDTGSRMDEMIFEEFKGTGNMDLVLDRSLFDQRIFPAIDINRSGTRRDDLLMNKEELAATYHLRRTLAALDNDKAVTLLIDRLKNTKSNAHFMEVVAKSARQSNNAS